MYENLFIAALPTIRFMFAVYGCVMVSAYVVRFILNVLVFVISIIKKNNIRHSTFSMLKYFAFCIITTVFYFVASPEVFGALSMSLGHFFMPICGSKEYTLTNFLINTNLKGQSVYDLLLNTKLCINSNNNEEHQGKEHSNIQNNENFSHYTTKKK